MFAFKCREVSYLGPESKNSMKKCLFLFLYSYTADIEKKKRKKQALIYMGADYAQINCVFVFRCFVLIRRT